MRIRGSRSLGRAQVFVDGKELDHHASLKVWSHSPDGFEWGYRGSGPAQLALALLLHAGVPEDKAVEGHQALKEEVVAALPYDFEVDLTVSPDGAWSVTGDDWRDRDRSPTPLDPH